MNILHVAVAALALHGLGNPAGSAPELVTGQAAADGATLVATNASFTNNSGRTLYIYYGFTRPGVTIFCDNFADGGVFPAGAQRSFTVPEGQLMWIRFQESTEGRGCPSNNNKFETWVTGMAGANPSISVI
ncbi:MAG TPA: hypothetical protein VEQ60_06990 [Longimicrobium sp.]|nr:hypothetical protein [Longimicrobium sp.]